MPKRKLLIQVIIENYGLWTIDWQLWTDSHKNGIIFVLKRYGLSIRFDAKKIKVKSAELYHIKELI